MLLIFLQNQLLVNYIQKYMYNNLQEHLDKINRHREKDGGILLRSYIGEGLQWLEQQLMRVDDDPVMVTPAAPAAGRSA